MLCGAGGESFVKGSGQCKLSLGPESSLDSLPNGIPTFSHKMRQKSLKFFRPWMPLFHSLNWSRNAKFEISILWRNAFDCFAILRSLTEIAPSAHDLVRERESEQSIKSEEKSNTGKLLLPAKFKLTFHPPTLQSSGCRGTECWDIEGNREEWDEILKLKY